MEKLTEEEMNQLKSLLLRYLAYQAQGIINKTVETILSRWKKTPAVIDVTPQPTHPEPIPAVPRESRQARRISK